MLFTMARAVARSLRIRSISEKWEPYYTTKIVDCPDGPLTGIIMRRRDGQKIVYRKPTPEEETEAMHWWSNR